MGKRAQADGEQWRKRGDQIMDLNPQPHCHLPQLRHCTRGCTHPVAIQPEAQRTPQHQGMSAVVWLVLLCSLLLSASVHEVSAGQPSLLPAEVFTVSPGVPVRRSWSPALHPEGSAAVQRFRLVDLQVGVAAPSTCAPLLSLIMPTCTDSLLGFAATAPRLSLTTRCASPTWALSVWTSRRFPSTLHCLHLTPSFALLCSGPTPPPCGW